MNENDMFPASRAARKKRTPKKDLEGAVVRECLQRLAKCDQVVYFERRNTGAVQFEDGGFIRFGSKGAGDIWCLIVQHFGSHQLLTHVEIEAKRRDGKGHLSLDQKAFQQFCEKVGIPYLVVTSDKDMVSQLQNAGLLT